MQIRLIADYRIAHAKPQQKKQTTVSADELKARIAKYQNTGVQDD